VGKDRCGGGWGGERGGGRWGGDPVLELAAALTWRMMLGGEAGKPNRGLNHHQLPKPPTPPRVWVSK